MAYGSPEALLPTAILNLPMRLPTWMAPDFVEAACLISIRLRRFHSTFHPKDTFNDA
jgi:hypothetical protein